MGYCTRSDFKNTLAQTLTTASPNPASLAKPAKLTELGKQLNLTSPTGSSVGTYTLEEVDYYIRMASSLVDAALSAQYVVPIPLKTMFTMNLYADINEYNANAFKVSRVENLNIGDILVLVQQTVEEKVTISDIDADGYITLEEPLMNDYDSSITRVLCVKFPDPIPYITAKLACAMFYDKYAKAQQEPAKSEFSEILRKEATAELNNIREGRTTLKGLERIGHRFVNPNLYARYAMDSIKDQDSTRSDQGRG
jgi:hypothetical protein